MAKKVLVDLDLAKNSLNNARIQNLAADPSSPVVGQTYFNTTSNKLRTFNGTTWDEYGTSTANGTVTSVSVVSANGFAGTVATPSTTPAITLTTSVNGLVKGNGTALSAAAAGTDYQAAITATGLLKGAGAGSVSAAVSGTDYAPATSGSTALKSNGSGGFASATLNDVGTPTADFAMGSHKITGLLDPTTAQDAATKNYVDATAQGLDVKASVRAATTGAETFTVTTGSVTQINGTAVDGITVAIGDRILIKDAPAATGVGSANSAQPGNGIYTVTANTTNLTVARATDQSGTNNPAGDFVFVEAGTTNAAAGYVVSTPSSTAAFTYGTGNIQWTQFSGAGEITAGTGLAKSGNTLSVASTYAGGTSIATVGTITTGTWTGTAIAVANGGTGATTASAARTNLAATGKFTGTIGDGTSTAIAVTHNLGTQWVIAQIFDATSNLQVECDVTLTSSTVTTFTFATAPAANAYRIVIVG